MATFAERAQVATNAEFRARVAIALTRVALRCGEENKASASWTRKRVDLAVLVLRDPQGATARFALVLAAMDVPLTATDEELEALTYQAWDAVSGVGQDDRPLGRVT
jgi:hypothetical protein